MKIETAIAIVLAIMAFACGSYITYQIDKSVATVTDQLVIDIRRDLK